MEIVTLCQGLGARQRCELIVGEPRGNRSHELATTARTVGASDQAK
jgi:hypothetical protein